MVRSIMFALTRQGKSLTDKLDVLLRVALGHLLPRHFAMKGRAAIAALKVLDDLL